MVSDVAYFQKCQSRIADVLGNSGLFQGRSYQIAPLSPDGSERVFFRIIAEDMTSLLLVFPAGDSPVAMSEALSCHLIASHLGERKVPVPRVYYFDRDSGGVIYEDLGGQSLHGLLDGCRNKMGIVAGESGHLPLLLEKYYKESLDALIGLQIKGVSGFKKEYCWQSVKYDTRLILERETGYFLESYCRGFLGLAEFADDLYLEFQELARRAVCQPADYLMHRDFQSRNIMIHQERIRIIDFQGARFGPLAYDVASLLNDPYASLPYDVRESLLEYYIKSLSNCISLDRESFLEGYCHIALLRNLQILGAFAYLSKVLEKKFFGQFIEPARQDLFYKLSGPLGEHYPVLLTLVQYISPENK